MLEHLRLNALPFEIVSLISQDAVTGTKMLGGFEDRQQGTQLRLLVSRPAENRLNIVMVGNRFTNMFWQAPRARRVVTHNCMIRIENTVFSIDDATLVARVGIRLRGAERGRVAALQVMRGQVLQARVRNLERHEQRLVAALLRVLRGLDLLGDRDLLPGPSPAVDVVEDLYAQRINSSGNPLWAVDGDQLVAVDGSGCVSLG